MAIRRKKNFQQRRRGPEHNLNKYIRHPEVRITGDDVESKVCSIEEALRIAEELELDLVEITATAKPPVCRIVDYKKFLYDKKKKEKEIKSKAQKTVIKEIRFTPNTDTHDFEFKAKHAEGFLAEGAKLKVYVQFRGRSIVFKDQGFELMNKFIERMGEDIKVEQPPKMEGRRIVMFIASTKQKK